MTRAGYKPQVGGAPPGKRHDDDADAERRPRDVRAWDLLRRTLALRMPKALRLEIEAALK